MITAGIISHGHSNTLLNATETGEQWGTFKGGQMAGWPRQCCCCINDPKGVAVILFFSFILPGCLPFCTQTNCNFVPVFGHRTGSAVFPQHIPHSIPSFHTVIITSVSRLEGISNTCIGLSVGSKGEFVGKAL